MLTTTLVAHKQRSRKEHWTAAQTNTSATRFLDGPATTAAEQLITQHGVMSFWTDGGLFQVLDDIDAPDPHPPVTDAIDALPITADQSEELKILFFNAMRERGASAYLLGVAVGRRLSSLATSGARLGGRRGRPERAGAR